MRLGVTVSSVGHATLIALGLISLTGGERLPPPMTQSIAVDLVPISEISSVSVGVETSEVVDSPAPAAVESEQEAEPAQRTGNTEQDQPIPEITETPSPAPTVETAPAPPARPEPAPVQEPALEPEPAPEPEPNPEPAPGPEPEPQPAPEPVPQPSPEPVEQPVLVAEPEAPAEPEIPAPVPPQSTNVAQLREDFRRQQEAAAQAERERAQREAEERARREAEEQARRAAEAEAEAEAERPTPTETPVSDIADRIAEIINQEPSRGATTGAGGEQSLGAPTGQSATLTQSEMDALVAAMRRCWIVPPAAINAPGLATRFVITLGPDGAVQGMPEMRTQPTDQLHQSTALAAQRAIVNCSPYTMLPPEKYESWRQIDVTFDPQDNW